ncbi:protein kinase domain-containing protein [Micromonospora sp. NPDC003197]
MISVLTAAGLSIEYVKRTNDLRVWGLYVKPSEMLRAALGENREILVLVAQYPKFQAREIDQATSIIATNGVRLSRSLGIVITGDKRTGELVAEISEDSQILFVGFSLDRIRSCRPHGAQDFKLLLQAQTYARDLYDLPGAITRSQDFFGRRRLLERLRQEVVTGSGHQGVFGLRKIGKTSLVNRLAQLVRDDGRCYVAQIDLQRAAAIRPDAAYILWSIGQAIYDSHRQVREVKFFRLFGRYSLFSDIPEPSLTFELFDHDLRHLISSRKRRVAIFLDEIERILPPSGSAGSKEEFVRVWRILRGLDQQYYGRLSFIISGTNPKCVEDARIGNEDNPIYNYFTREYLKPFSLDETGDLLATVGQRIGIRWSPRAISEAFAQTGGHPAILRALGSAAHNKKTNRREPVTIEQQDVRALSRQLLVERTPLLAQLVSTLRDEYPDEYFLLSLLAEGKVHEFAELARTFPSDVAHLVGYGICRAPTDTPQFAVKLLQTHLQRQSSEGARPTNHHGSRLVEGEQVGDYIIETKIGRPSGFATVYRAREIDGPRLVAIKVIKGGRLSSVQRELDVLQTLNHKNIVKILDAGSLPNGDPFLVMQYISGPTLHEFCEASSRPSEVTLLKWATQLLSALVSMHPRPSEVDTLRKQHDELDGEVVQAIFEAQHGVVHRDIKPDNIILSSEHGPVLIDFNISVRAGSAVRTISSTPNYLPPGLMIGHWSHEVDLYQLGLTLLQLAAGARITKATLEDLHVMAKQSISPRTMTFLDRLLSFQTSSGYRLTSDALRDAKQALGALSRRM